MRESGHSRLDYEILVDSIKHRPAMKWCEQQFGTRWNVIDNRTGQWALFWAGRGMTDKYRFCFAVKEDMMMFILRWS
jgi:hypothetical protein